MADTEPTASTPDDEQNENSLADFFFQVIDIAPGTARTLLPDLLDAIRLNLGMEVGFLSRFDNGRRIFECVSDDGEHSMIRVGDSDPLEDSYCHGVVQGHIPNFIHNAQEHEAVKDFAATRELGVGAHISVPIQMQEGDIYGTLCCFSTQPNESLDERDVSFMSVIADLVGAILQREIAHLNTIEDKRQGLDDMIQSGAMQSVWQPIVNTETGQVISVEALTRFNTRPYRPPNEWFDEAAEVGCHTTLERNALIKGLAILAHLPAGTFVSCNLSGQALLDLEIQDFLQDRKLDRIVLEITEHDIIADYESLLETLTPLRKAGMMLAIDDFGAGYASFRHIVGLDPDIVKIDMSLVREIDSNATAQSIVRALCAFAEENQRHLVAEGVETEQEMQTLRSLGVTRVQGYLLHKPMGRDDLMQVLRPH